MPPLIPIGTRPLVVAGGEEPLVVQRPIYGERLFWLVVARRWASQVLVESLGGLAWVNEGVFLETPAGETPTRD